MRTLRLDPLRREWKETESKQYPTFFCVAGLALQAFSASKSLSNTKKSDIASQFPYGNKNPQQFQWKIIFLRLVICWFGNPTAKRQIKSATDAGTIPCSRQPHLSVSYTYKVRLRNLTYFRQIDVPPHWVFCRISSKFAQLFGILMQFVTNTPPSKWLIFKKFFMIKNCPL